MLWVLDRETRDEEFLNLVLTNVEEIIKLEKYRFKGWTSSE